MGWFDSLRAHLSRNNLEAVDYAPTSSAVSTVLGMSPDQLYRTQPHLRTVVSFLARNIAQLGFQVFERVSDTDRRRVKDDPAARTLRQPNPTMTSYELFYSLVSELKLHDIAVWATIETPEAESGWHIWPIPQSWITTTGGGNPYAPAWIQVAGAGGKQQVLTADQFLIFHGWDPANPGKGVSPVVSLRHILAEQIQAWSYREQVWQRGGRVGTVMTRPAGAPSWSSEAREKFSRDWAAKWTGQHGPKAGGTPILEDGMELKRIGYSAREDEWSEVAKLSLATVAAVYHTSPTMVGILDNANFSNVKEFSRMLYTDTLGPDMAMIEDRINTFLIPRMSRRTGLYGEFNVAEKLQGSFEEQAAVISTSVGRPWMTADEARSRFNMPALGGDAAALVTPLNVLVGGQASPQDSGTQNVRSGQVLTPELLEAAAMRHLISLASRNPEAALAALTGEQRKSGPSLSGEGTVVRVKAEARKEDTQTVEAVLVRFFKRQRAVVLSAMGAKAQGDWWDGERWDRELADDLHALSMTVTEGVAAETLKELGVDQDVYSAARTAKFLRAVAESRAGAINATTHDQLTAAAEQDDEDAEGSEAIRSTPAGVFDLAESSRVKQMAVTLATTLAGFAVTEVGKQMGRPKTMKTWVTHSGKSRPSHAAMNGQTVPVADRFSNGMDWPGDPAGGADEVAGCACGIEITIP